MNNLLNVLKLQKILLYTWAILVQFETVGDHRIFFVQKKFKIMANNSQTSQSKHSSKQVLIRDKQQKRKDPPNISTHSSKKQKSITNSSSSSQTEIQSNNQSSQSSVPAIPQQSIPTHSQNNEIIQQQVADPSSSQQQQFDPLLNLNIYDYTQTFQLMDLQCEEEDTVENEEEDVDESMDEENMEDTVEDIEQDDDEPIRIQKTSRKSPRKTTKNSTASRKKGKHFTEGEKMILLEVYDECDGNWQKIMDHEKITSMGREQRQLQQLYYRLNHAAIEKTDTKEGNEFRSDIITGFETGEEATPKQPVSRPTSHLSQAETKALERSKNLVTKNMIQSNDPKIQTKDSFKEYLQQEKTKNREKAMEKIMQKYQESLENKAMVNDLVTNSRAIAAQTEGTQNVMLGILQANQMLMASIIPSLKQSLDMLNRQCNIGTATVGLSNITNVIPSNVMLETTQNKENTNNSVDSLSNQTTMNILQPNPSATDSLSTTVMLQSRVESLENKFDKLYHLIQSHFEKNSNNN